MSARGRWRCAVGREFVAQSATPGLRLQRAALGPELEIPLLRDQSEADLLGKLRLGLPFPLGGGRWRCFPTQGDFNETSDRLWKDATQGRPLWKGESFDQFDPHGAEARLPGEQGGSCQGAQAAAGPKSLLADEVPLATRRKR